MKNISILGCGWLGLPLARHFIKKGYQVKGSTTTPTKMNVLSDLGILPYLLARESVEANLGDFFDTDLLILNTPPRNTSEDPSSHHRFISSIVSQIQPNHTKTIYTSSTAVYPSLNRDVSESDAVSSSRSRGGVKLLEIEDLIAQNNNTTILRFGGLYGPGRHPGRFLSGKTVHGKNNPVNMIHLDDCIGVIQSIIDCQLWNERFNACSPQHPTKETFYTQACRELDLPAPLFTDKPTDYKRIDSSKLLQATSYVFQHGLQ
ncbi:hypothetical protein BFP72_12520 [Reichenbachiella sp. 5M10]|uniref:SDR family oxidoreductase n=1 Tax=Reichenbachiella sp. 5M10 TaxID=1889772 RepID=UPI000C161C86|nr:SDR family oxidoreductase [Reichenbachiella sp. 5M10]PIB36160.1 hypothetical protein BFP72_12520 [Reichenbachiella sp. 5M10]